MRGGLAIALGAVAVTVLSARLALSSGLGADYSIDAGPPLDALAAGDLERFFAEQPLMGSFSVLLRWPFVALAGGDELLAYRLGSLPLVLAAGVLAVCLERLMARNGQPLAARLVVAGACLVNPVIADALVWGHPEELLGGALCVGAVLAAMRGKVVLAAVLLGLAIATKQWAVIAVLPVFIALPQQRLRAAVISGAIALSLTAPLLALNPTSFSQRAEAAAHTGEDAGALVTSLNVWWPTVAAKRENRVFDGVEWTTVAEFSMSPSLARVIHPLIVLLAVPLCLLFWRRRRELPVADVLALLALLFLLRCVLDLWNNQYYHVPFVLSLLAWEGLTRRGLPVVSMLTLMAMWLSLDVLPTANGHGATNAMYLAWTLPLAAYLAAHLYAPGPLSLLAGRRPALLKGRDLLEHDRTHVLPGA